MPVKMLRPIDSVSEAAWEWDFVSERLMWTVAFRQFFGIPSDVSPSFERWLQAIAPEDRARVEQKLHEAWSATGVFVIDSRRISAAQVRWTRIAGRVFAGPDGTPARAAGIAHDVSEGTLTPQAVPGTIESLTRRVEELDPLMDLLPFPTVIAEDPECRFVRSNDAFNRLFDIEADINASVTAYGAQRVPWRVMRGGRELTMMELPIQRCAALGLPVHGEDVEIRFDDGRMLYLEVSVVPLVNADLTPRGAVGVLIDMTDRRSPIKSAKPSIVWSRTSCGSRWPP
jgi:PAS domain-containing protein